jgi:hypothetical protein
MKQEFWLYIALQGHGALGLEDEVVSSAYVAHSPQYVDDTEPISVTVLDSRMRDLEYALEQEGISLAEVPLPEAARVPTPSDSGTPGIDAPKDGGEFQLAGLRVIVAITIPGWLALAGVLKAYIAHSRNQSAEVVYPDGAIIKIVGNYSAKEIEQMIRVHSEGWTGRTEEADDRWAAPDGDPTSSG